MKCRKCREMIFAYRELSRDEQQLVNSHVQSCSECATVFADVQKMQKLLGDIPPSNTATGSDPQLTLRIMNALPAEQPVLIRRLSGIFDLPALRYGLAAASLALVALFVAETTVQPDFERRHKTFFSRDTGRPAALNSVAAGERVRDAVITEGLKSSISLQACIRICQETTSGGDCDECKTKYLKNIL